MQNSFPDLSTTVKHEDHEISLHNCQRQFLSNEVKNRSVAGQQFKSAIKHHVELQVAPTSPEIPPIGVLIKSKTKVCAWLRDMRASRSSINTFESQSECAEEYDQGGTSQRDQPISHREHGVAVDDREADYGQLYFDCGRKDALLLLMGAETGFSECYYKLVGNSITGGVPRNLHGAVRNHTRVAEPKDLVMHRYKYNEPKAIHGFSLQNKEASSVGPSTQINLALPTDSEDLAQRRKEYPNIKFWTEKDYKLWNAKERQEAKASRTAPARAERGTPMRFIDFAWGGRADYWYAANVRRYAYELFGNLKTKGIAPAKWGEVTSAAKEFFVTKIEKAFAPLQLCQSHWKANAVAKLYYATWARKNLKGGAEPAQEQTLGCRRPSSLGNDDVDEPPPEKRMRNSNESFTQEYSLSIKTGVPNTSQISTPTSAYSSGAFSFSS